MKWSKSFRVFIYTLATILVFLYHIIAINKAYSSGVVLGLSGHPQVFASLTLSNIESLEAENMKKLSETLENELDLHLGKMLWTKRLNAPWLVRLTGNDITGSMMMLNLPVLEKAAEYRAQNPGPFLMRRSNDYNELMKYLSSSKPTERTILGIERTHMQKSGRRK